MHGRQGGDPAKLAAALMKIAARQSIPVRFPAGADAVRVFEGKAHDPLTQANAHRELSSSLDHDNT